MATCAFVAVTFSPFGERCTFGLATQALHPHLGLCSRPEGLRRARPASASAWASPSRSPRAGSRRPHPVADFGRVLQVLSRVGPGPGDRSLQFGDQGWRAVLRPAFRTHTLQGVHSQVVAAHAVKDDHVERGRRRALLGEATHVEAVYIHVAVHDLVDCALVAVEGEDDLLVGGEELDEARLAHAVRVKLAREERHQVHDVYDADLELGRVLTQPVRRRDGLEGRDVTGTGQYDVRLLAFGYVARPLPDRGARRGVLYGRVHVQPLKLGLLVYRDEVHVVSAAQTV